MRSGPFALGGLVLALASCQGPERPERLELRVLTYNIHHGRGTDGQIDLERIAEVILSTRPDLVALQEVDRRTGRSNNADQARLDMAPLAPGRTARMDLHAVARSGIEGCGRALAAGVIGPVFWYLLFGFPGLLVFKLLRRLMGFWISLYTPRDIPASLKLLLFISIHSII